MASSGRPLAIAAVTAWVLTASIGGYMLRTWVVRGGLRRQRATGVGVPPAVVFGHASAALCGLAIWIAFVKTDWDPLAWTGVVLIAAAISLGVCTVTLWTPFPVIVPPVAAPAATPEAAPPADAFGVTDEMIASFLAAPAPARRPPRVKLAGLIPVVHGFGALTTFMLAVLAAISARLGMFRSQWSRPMGTCTAFVLWDHGRNADDDGRTRASRRRSVEHRRRAGGLLRPGHQDRGGDVHQRRVR